MTDYQALLDSALTAASAYYSGDNSPVTDAEYDELLVEIQQFEQANPDDVIEHGLFTHVAAGTAGGGDATHSRPMLSLDKATTADEVRAFLARVVETDADATVFVEPKVDGMAVSVEYQEGDLVRIVTRGDGRTGELVTDRLARQQVFVHGLPWVFATFTGVIRGELYMSASDFAISNANRIAAGKTAFANPRNATAGTVRAETLDYDVQLSFIAHDAPEGTDVTIPGDFAATATSLGGVRAFRASDADAVINAIEDFGALRAGFPIPTDGVVVKVIDHNVRAELGETSRAPRWAVAYKFEAQTAETVIRDIIVEVGRTGNLSFTAVFDPVLVDGSTIARASLHNVDLIRTKGIRIGSKATVFKANDIIPQVLSVVNGPETSPWAPPTSDADGFPYDTAQVIWRSTNPADSLSALITYAASRDVLDIDTLGRSVADALIEAGLVATVADLFALTEDAVAAMAFGDTVYGPVRAKTLLANIEKAKGQTLARFITALGIRLTGRTFGRRLAKAFGSLDALVNATREQLLEVEGVGPERAEVIHAGLAANRGVISALIASGIDPREESAAAGSALAGLSVVVTGGMTGPLAELSRNQMNELIEAHGGRASGSVSKNTSLVVAGDGAGSKLAKAESLGIEVISSEEFASRLGVV